LSALRPQWQVQPQSIRISSGSNPQRIALSIRGDVDAPVYASSNPDIVQVDESGVVLCGPVAGNAMVMIWRSAARDSLRHMMVEVRDPSWFTNHPDFATGAGIELFGVVINAVNTAGVPGALVAFRRSETGTVTAQTYTDGSGQFVITLAEGTYYVEASAPGYINWHSWVTVDPSASDEMQIVLSPELIGQFARVVLQWGLNPRDLDSHLTGPRPAGGVFHVFYSHTIENEAAELDVDDTSSYGPETITIFRLIPGTYRYCVHDYTNRYANPSYGLAQSGASVKVFINDNQELTFNVPNQAGTVWTVFEIEGATGRLIPVNAMSHVSEPNNVGL
jgi:hypothetical protein